MPDKLPEDQFFTQLCEGYTDSEIIEIQQYLEEWDAELLTAALRGYASQLQVRDWIENPATAIDRLQTLRIFSIPSIAQFYFDRSRDYPKLKEYVRKLDYIRLLLLEYLQSDPTTRSDLLAE